MFRLTAYKINILKLFSGTSISQIITVLSSPILTRIYTPNDFGVYAIFISISSLLSISAALRLDTAIVVPKDITVVIRLTSVAITISSIFSVITSLISVVIFIVMDYGFGLGHYVLLLGFSVFLHTTYNVLYFYSLRNNSYSEIAKSKVLISLSILFVSVGTPYLINGPLGLVLAVLVGYSVGVIFLFYRSKFRITKIKMKEITDQIKNYKSFPIYDLPAAFLIQFSLRMPIILFATTFSSAIVGQFAMTQRVLDLPISFITSAVSDTFKQKAMRDNQEHGNCIRVFNETRNLLFFLAIIPFIVILVWSKELFPLFLGDNWKLAGEFAQILSLMFFIRFVVGPLTYTFYVKNKLKSNLVGQIFKAILNFGALGVGILQNNVFTGLIAFSVINIIVNMVYYYYSLKYAK